jgi:hypothetical protein
LELFVESKLKDVVVPPLVQESREPRTISAQSSLTAHRRKIR